MCPTWSLVKTRPARTTPSAKYICKTYKTSTWLLNCFRFSFNLWSMTHRNEFNTSHLSPEVHLWLLIPIWKRWWYWLMVVAWMQKRGNCLVVVRGCKRWGTHSWNYSWEFQQYNFEYLSYVGWPLTDPQAIEQGKWIVKFFQVEYGSLNDTLK